MSQKVQQEEGMGSRWCKAVVENTKKKGLAAMEDADDGDGRRACSTTSLLPGAGETKTKTKTRMTTRTKTGNWEPTPKNSHFDVYWLPMTHATYRDAQRRWSCFHHLHLWDMNNVVHYPRGWTCDRSHPYPVDLHALLLFQWCALPSSPAPPVPPPRSPPLCSSLVLWRHFVRRPPFSLLPIEKEVQAHFHHIVQKVLY